MRKLTPEGQQLVDSIAGRYGLSSQAVAMMLDSVAAGGGTMAQFNIPELGGSGQWMQGGMTMVGDMFNHGLKMTVDNLCAELSTLYFNQPYVPPAQHQVQGQSQGSGAGVSLFIPGSDGKNWWPPELGQPASSGGQNNMRYAYFPHVRRLAVDAGGMICIYDTLDHQIGGFSQQQAYDGSITLTSQYGTVLLSRLPRVSLENPLANSATQNMPAASVSSDNAHEPVANGSSTPHSPEMTQNAQPSSAGTDDILSKIEKLGELREKGFISDDEFNTKKSELLSRL